MSETNGPPCEKPSTALPDKPNKEPRKSKRPCSLMSIVYECIKEHGPITTDRVIALCGHHVPTESAIRRYEAEFRNRKWKHKKSLEGKIKYGTKGKINLAISNLNRDKRIKRLGESKHKQVSTWVIVD